MKRAVFAAIVAAVGFWSVSPVSTADAQSSAGEKKKVKSYDFTGDDIDGELIRPDGLSIDTRTFAEHGSLIRIRTDFLREILQSAEDL